MFERVRSDFPLLKMDLNTNPENIDVLLMLKKQPGLTFEIWAYLEGDELHINTGTFWLSWFPCDRSDVREAYVEALEGLISGRYRLLEHYVGDRVWKSELQQPMGDEWQTIGTSGARGGLFLPWWRPRNTRVIQNA